MDAATQLDKINGLSRAAAWEAARHVAIQSEGLTPQQPQRTGLERYLADQPMKNLPRLEQLSRTLLKLSAITPSLADPVERAVKGVGRKQAIETPKEFDTHIPTLIMMLQAVAQQCKAADAFTIEQAADEIVIRLKVGEPVHVPKEFARALSAEAMLPIRVLHLSDLHFTGQTPVTSHLQSLLDDLRRGDGMDIAEIDHIVVSGDFTNKGSLAGFDKAHEFVAQLLDEFALEPTQIILVPGNHDVVDRKDAYSRKKQPPSSGEDGWVKEGDRYLAPNPANYPLRFQPFSEGLFGKILEQQYPTDSNVQGFAIPFWKSGLQFVALNSCWQIDSFHRKRSGINAEARAHALREAGRQVKQAQQDGQLSGDAKILRIAVWHHAVQGPEQMQNTEFLSHLQNNQVKLGMHGDVHQLRRDLVGHWRGKKQLHILGAGSFGSRAEDRPESTPRLYNFLEIYRDLKRVKVHTRSQLTADSAWRGWNEWPREDGSEGGVPYYEVSLK